MKEYNLYNPAQFPWWFVNIFVLLWFGSLLLDGMLTFASKEFSTMDRARQRKVVSYIVLAVGTTFALIAQLRGGMDIIFSPDHSWARQDQADWISVSLTTVSILYLWDLVYRLHSGFALLVNHIVTIMLIQLVIASYFDLGHVTFLRFAIFIGFLANTEQLSYLALVVYQLEIATPHFQCALLYVAALVSLLFKTMAMACCMYLYVDAVVRQSGSDEGAAAALSDEKSNWNVFWKFCFVPFLLFLYVSQLHACYRLYTHGREAKASLNQPASGSKLDEKTEDDGERVVSPVTEAAPAYSNSYRDADHMNDKHWEMSLDYERA